MRQQAAVLVVEPTFGGGDARAKVDHLALDADHLVLSVMART